MFFFVYMSFLVSLLLAEINGIQNVLQLKKDNQWRLHKRHDIYTHPRFFVWKPVLPQQMYVSPKTLVPAPMSINNYNRYGFPHVAAAPMHHQSYMFAIPTTKANNYPYQAVKDMGDKRKPGNFHHITIINAVIPKPYFPPPTPPTQHLQKSFRKYRNNKQLYHQYLNTQHPGSTWPNDNYSRIPIVSQMQNLVAEPQPTYEKAATLASQADAIDKKSSHLLNSFEHQHQEGINIENKFNLFQCGRKLTDDSMQVSSNNLHNLCTIFGNLQNATQQNESQSQPQIHKEQNVVMLSTFSPGAPSTTTIKSLKSSRSTDGYTTQKSIFLPTPINFVSVKTTVATASNLATSLPLKQNVEIVSNFRPTRNDAQQHSFFTIEDAITKAPAVNHIFNDPNEAYRHARRRQQHYIKPKQEIINTTPRTTVNSLFKNFFDDNVYDTSETQHVDDYSTIDNYQDNEKPISYFSYRNNEYRRPNRTKIIHNNNNNVTDSDPVFRSSHQYKSVHSERYISTTPYNYMSTVKSTTVVPPPNIFELFNGKNITTMATKYPSLTALTTYTNRDERQEIDATTTFASTEKPIHTTTTTAESLFTTTTENNKFKKVLLLKRPFHPTPTSVHKYQKPVRGLFKSYKSTTSLPVKTPTTTSLPVTKKKHKYQRQYKSKKNKHIKYASTLQPISSTRYPPTTSTVEAISPKRMKSQAILSSSESTKVQKIKVQQRILPNQSRSSKRLQGHKSTETPRTASFTKPREKNKSIRRRKQLTTETVKPTPSTPPTFQTATTTMKILRTNETRTTKPGKIVEPNEVYDDFSFTVNNSKSIKMSPTKDGSVPPLPIEIYFKKSQNAQI